MARKYRIYCITEAVNKFIIGDINPTVCPTNAGHTVNLSSVGVVENYTDTLSVFGDASDGDITISADTTITRDMYYRNVTFTGVFKLFTGGFRVFIADTLSLGAGCIACIGGNGSPATGAGVGGGAASSAARTLGYGSAGGAGGSGGTNGLPGGSLPTNTRIGGAGGAGGASGNKNGGAAGSAVVNPATSGGVGVFRCGEFAIIGRNIANIQMNGGVGGGGGGGPNGGGGGGGGGCVVVCARNITWTTGDFCCGGGIGSAPSSSTGGGGGGGGGGYICVITTSNISALVLDLSGGAGGVSPSATNGVAGAVGNGFKIII